MPSASLLQWQNDRLPAEAVVITKTGGPTVAKKKLIPKLGDHVKERGPLGPKGSLVFRIRVEYDPEPRFVEVLEEE